MVINPYRMVTIRYQGISRMQSSGEIVHGTNHPVELCRYPQPFLSQWGLSPSQKHYMEACWQLCRLSLVHDRRQVLNYQTFTSFEAPTQLITLRSRPIQDCRFSGERGRLKKTFICETRGSCQSTPFKQAIGCRVLGTGNTLKVDVDVVVNCLGSSIV